MIYYRCKCGKAESWSSMGVSPCRGCSECNTTLATSPDNHLTPAPHQWTKEFNSGSGARIDDVCMNCLTKRPFADDGLYEKGEPITATLWG